MQQKIKHFTFFFPNYIANLNEFQSTKKEKLLERETEKKSLCVILIKKIFISQSEMEKNKLIKCYTKRREDWRQKNRKIIIIFCQQLTSISYIRTKRFFRFLFCFDIEIIRCTVVFQLFMSNNNSSVLSFSNDWGNNFCYFPISFLWR